MARVHERRLKKLVRILDQQDVPAALLLGSAAPKPSSGDQFFPFRQNSNFFYLTGSEAPDLLLLLSPSSTPVLLFAPPTDRVKVLWDGAGPNVRQLARNVGAELIITKAPEQEVIKRLKGVDRLYFQNDAQTRAWSIAERLIETPAHLRGTFPSQFHHCDELLVPLRAHKDQTEVALIREASDATNNALFDAVPLLSPGVTESFAAAAIDFFFQTQECKPGFSTIVAGGRNAATLHHTPSARPIRANELVLIDCGACKAGYSADITRVVPISGEFTPQQRVLYSGVLRAQKAAIKKIRHGALIRDVYMSAAEEITEALVEARVLRGKTSALVKRKAFQPYFPHGIGHPLGLDVHDVGNLRGNPAATLEEGMVFTVEPGLYIPKTVGKVLPIGIRIEDDVLVTRRGCKVLTDGFPKDPDEVEHLMQRR